MMRAVQLRSRTPWDIALADLPWPSAGAGSVRIGVEAVGLCGSDVHAVRGDEGYEWVPSGVVLGHEIAGRVLAVGSDDDESLVGRAVVVRAIGGCADCADCAAGWPNSCPARTCIGLHSDGGLADELVVPRSRIHVLDDEPLDPAVAALIEPAAVAAHAVSLLPQPLAGLRVGVSGPGAVGLLTALHVREHGGDATVFGPAVGAADRLDAARRLGFATVAGAPAQDAPTFDAWVDCAGASSSLDLAIAEVARRGTIVIPAMFAAPPRVDVTSIVRRQLQLVGSYGYRPDDFVAAERVVRGAAAPLRSLISEFPLGEVAAALRGAADASLVKPVVRVNGLHDYALRQTARARADALAPAGTRRGRPGATPVAPNDHDPSKETRA